MLAYDRSRASDSRDLSFDLAAEFEYEPEGRDDELEVELEFERDRERESSREEVTDEAELEEDELLPAELTLEDEDELETELSLDVDYERGWGEHGEIELGYDGERTDSDYNRLIRLVEDPAAPPGRLDDRGHTEGEDSHSVYTTVQGPVGEARVQAGCRRTTARHGTAGPR